MVQWISFLHGCWDQASHSQTASSAHLHGGGKEAAVVSPHLPREGANQPSSPSSTGRTCRRGTHRLSLVAGAGQARHSNQAEQAGRRRAGGWAFGQGGYDGDFPHHHHTFFKTRKASGSKYFNRCGSVAMPDWDCLQPPLIRDLRAAALLSGLLVSPLTPSTASSHTLSHTAHGGGPARQYLACRIGADNTHLPSLRTVAGSGRGERAGHSLPPAYQRCRRVSIASLSQDYCVTPIATTPGAHTLHGTTSPRPFTRSPHPHTTPRTLPGTPHALLFHPRRLLSP